MGVSPRALAIPVTDLSETWNTALERTLAG